MSKIKLATISSFRVALQATLLIVFLIGFQTDCKSETVDYLDKCVADKCLSKPNNVAISSDGTGLFTIDSSENPYIRKLKFSSNGFTESGTIPLNILNSDSVEFEISLSKDNKKALVYGKSENKPGILLTVNLETNEIKALKSLDSDSPNLNSVSFIDTEGKKILAGNSNSSQGKLYIVNAESDQIEKTINIKDTPNSVKVSPNLKYAVITYRGLNTQSATIYDLEADESKDFETPPDIFFKIHNFLFSNSFDLSGTKTVISSIGGNHVLHFLDLKNKKMVVRILDENSDGQTLSAVYPDGKTAISVAANDTDPITLKIYKIDVSNPNSPSIVKTVNINDSSSVIDLDITPDQQKLFVLVLKGNNKVLKTYSLKSLTFISEFFISSNNSSTKLTLDPNSEFAAIPLPNTNLSVPSGESISKCGNGIVDPGEECDPNGQKVFFGTCDSCVLNCTGGFKVCNQSGCSCAVVRKKK